jgi:Protein of unknown function (DUF4019)
MTNCNTNRLLCRLTASLVVAVIGLIALQGAAAESLETADAAAVDAIKAWLKKIDEGRYLESWVSASAQFQKSIISANWVSALDSARKPLGACKNRTLASAFPQSSLPDQDGKMLQGEFVIAQFKSSFDNLNAALETVTFEKEGGVWKASGYFLRPDT